MDETKKGHRGGRSFLSGSLAGICSGVSLQPLGVVKTRLQVEVLRRSGTLSESPGMNTNKICQTEPLTARAVFRDLVAQGKGSPAMTVRSLWRGTGATIAIMAPKAGAYLSTVRFLRGELESGKERQGQRNRGGKNNNNTTKNTHIPDDAAAVRPTVSSPPVPRRFPPETDRTRRKTGTESGKREGASGLSAAENAFVGALARTASTVAVNPISIVKTRAEAGPGLRTPLWETLRSILAERGAWGLTKGMVPALARDCPHSAIHLAVYEHAKSTLMRACDTDTPAATVSSGAMNKLQSIVGGVIHPLSAATAAVVATLATHPPDVLRTQAQSFPRGITYAEVVRGVLGERGIRGLYAGMGMRLVRRALSSAIAWTVFEALAK